MTAEATAEALEWRERREPALARSFALAFAIHAVLLAVMFVGVRWQNYHPETVEVELWESPPPEPVVEAPKPPPPPKAEPEPVKPEPKPEKPPEITVREKPKPKPKPKPEPKKQEPKRDLELERQMIREQAALEQKVLEEQRRIADAQRQERQMRELLARQQSDARAKALAGWTDKIRAKIRGNISELVTREIPGDPVAVFDVTILPTGEVLTVRLRKSSGFKRYDEEVERAILKASPLPKPDQPGLFDRRLELSFRPKDQ